MTTPNPNPTAGNTKGYIEQFNFYLRDLRTWFVAYGIGGPVLFLTQEKIRAAIAGSGSGRSIAFLFLLGVAFQIASSVLGKWTSWIQYANTKDGSHSCLAPVAFWWAGNFWIDFLLDLGSVMMFGVATWKVLALFT